MQGGTGRANAEALTDEFISRCSHQKQRDWLSTMTKKGTIQDKIAALTLVVQENPLVRLDTLRQLIAQARKSNRREAGLAASSAADLFINDLLPNRKLRFYENCHSENASRPEQLLLYLFEDRLKALYTEFVQALADGARDNLEYIKKARLAVAVNLLESKPEQEQACLALNCCRCMYCFVFDLVVFVVCMCVFVLCFKYNLYIYLCVY
jgi:hypothetical protein